MSPSAGSSTPSSLSGTSPVNSSTTSFSSSLPQGLGHSPLMVGKINSLSPNSQSTMNSPWPHACSGPCTPNMSASGLSSPGVSPIGDSVTGSVSGPARCVGGLGNGPSPSPWSAPGTSSKPHSPGVGNVSTAALGLQFSNLTLEPGLSTSAALQPHADAANAVGGQPLAPFNTASTAFGTPAKAENGPSPGIIGAGIAKRDESLVNAGVKRPRGAR